MGLHWFIPAKGRLPASKGMEPKGVKEGKVRGEGKGQGDKGEGRDCGEQRMRDRRTEEGGLLALLLQSSLLIMGEERYFNMTRLSLAVQTLSLLFGRFVTVLHHSRCVTEAASTPAAGTEEET